MNRQHNRQKVQQDKQRSTKHTHKTKDQTTRTPLIPGVQTGAPEGWQCSCSASGTHRVNLGTNPVISDE